MSLKGDDAPTVPAVPNDSAASRVRRRPSEVNTLGGQGPRRGSGVVDLLRRYGTLLLLAALVLTFSLLSKSFLTSANITSILITQSVSSCVALAALLPLIIGDFDLSLGYMVGLLGVLGAEASLHGWGSIGILAAMIVGGALIGLLNGLLVVRLRISAFIATLASGIILSALSEGISGGVVVVANVPNFLYDVGNNSFLGIAISVWLVLILAAVLLYVLEYTPLGRRWYAIGGSERVAFMAGIPTNRLRVLAFVVAGIIVSFGAVFQLGVSGSADPSFGPDLLLPAYATVFLGVTTHRPGHYNVVGTVVAILLLAVGFNGLSLLGVPFWAEPLFDGVVLLIAVLLARAESRTIQIGK
jgi:ribose transport system permease protein